MVRLAVDPLSQEVSWTCKLKPVRGCPYSRLLCFCSIMALLSTIAPTSPLIILRPGNQPLRLCRGELHGPQKNRQRTSARLVSGTAAYSTAHLYYLGVGIRDWDSIRGCLLSFCNFVFNRAGAGAGVRGSGSGGGVSPHCHLAFSQMRRLYVN